MQEGRLVSRSSPATSASAKPTGDTPSEKETSGVGALQLLYPSPSAHSQAASPPHPKLGQDEPPCSRLGLGPPFPIPCPKPATPCSLWMSRGRARNPRRGAGMGTEADLMTPSLWGRRPGVPEFLSLAAKGVKRGTAAPGRRLGCFLAARGRQEGRQSAARAFCWAAPSCSLGFLKFGPRKAPRMLCGGPASSRMLRDVSIPVAPCTGMDTESSSVTGRAENPPICRLAPLFYE